MRISAIVLVTGALWMGAPVPAQPAPAPEPRVSRNVLLPPGPGNPRNSEGDFILLKDGRVLFVYSRFTGGSSDHAGAHLAGRFSGDGGATWDGEDRVIVPNEGGMNVMSVSLLRLRDGRIALFYLRKNSLVDCRPWMRLSTDEARTWSEPAACIPDGQAGYYVLNNDRAVQWTGARLVLPVALHNTPKQNRFENGALIMNYLSDDAGKTWRRSQSQRKALSPEGAAVILQEPGAVELRDGRLMIFCRTMSGTQYIAFSQDGGDTFSEFQPSPIPSPLSPASIERIPSTGDLLLVWNHSFDLTAKKGGVRTPLTTAISKDEGKTWLNIRTLEDDPDGWYCYTAIEFVRDQVLLAHCAGSQRRGTGLGVTQITRVPIAWLYAGEK